MLRDRYILHTAFPIGVHLFCISYSVYPTNNKEKTFYLLKYIYMYLFTSNVSLLFKIARLVIINIHITKPWAPNSPNKHYFLKLPSSTIESCLWRSSFWTLSLWSFVWSWIFLFRLKRPHRCVRCSTSSTAPSCHCPAAALTAVASGEMVLLAM